MFVKKTLKSVNTSKRKSSDEGKKCTKTIRNIKKGFLDKEKEIEVDESCFPWFLKFSVSFICYSSIYLYFSHG